MPNIEVWKTITDYPNYEVSTLGRIKNIKTKYITNGYLSNNYMLCKLTKNRKTKSFRVHRIVAFEFLPIIENKLEVNHLFSKTNNNLSNLEWCTRIENMIHAKQTIKFKKMPITYKIDINTKKIIKIYTKIEELKKDNYTINSIIKSINTKKSYKGYFWERDNDIVYNDEIWVSLSDSIYDQINIFTKYKVSNYGRIKGWYNRILSLNKSNIFETIKLTNNEKTITIKIHRLVLMAFNILQPEGKNEVDHIDSNRFNNKLDNLRWANRIDQLNNINSKIKIIEKNKINNSKKCIKIEVIYPSGEIEIIYGLNKLAKKIKIAPLTILKYANINIPYNEHSFKLI